MPATYWIARICEEFSCLPTAAVREWRRAPDGLIAQVIEARAFAATYHLYDRTDDKSTLPPSPMIDLVREIEMAAMKRKIEAEREASREPVSD